MKRVVRITEGDMHRIIKGAVNKVLKEDNMFSTHDGLGYNPTVADALEHAKECLGADVLCDRLAWRLAGQIGQRGLFDALKEILSTECHEGLDDDEDLRY